jgi:hypothetical protein
MSARRRWQNTWRGGGDHRRGRLFAIIPRPSHRLTCSLCQISFRLLYGLLILRHSRRKLLWLGVTAHPNAEWIARQLTEACGWNEAPRYLIRDRGGAYGETFIRRLEAMGIRDRPSSARSPWQNGHAERLIGSIRRDCLDHVVVFGERHLAICSIRTRDTTTRFARTYRCRRMRLSRVTSKAQAA